MNYIELINHFWRMHRLREFSAHEAFLYFALLNECNLRNWQNQVDYSTLSINLYEVEKLSEQEPQSFGEEVQQALSKTFSFLGEAGREVLKAAICVVAVLALPAVVVTVLILLIRHRRRKKKNMDADPEQK